MKLILLNGGKNNFQYSIKFTSEFDDYFGEAYGFFSSVFLPVSFVNCNLQMAYMRGSFLLSLGM